jgi:hypothetical protein
VCEDFGVVNSVVDASYLSLVDALRERRLRRIRGFRGVRYLNSNFPIRLCAALVDVHTRSHSPVTPLLPGEYADREDLIVGANGSIGALDGAHSIGPRVTLCCVSTIRVNSWAPSSILYEITVQPRR